MSFEIDIRGNVKQVTKHFDKMQRRQIPFAVSTTLNNLAVKAQSKIILHIRHVFNNRNRWYAREQRTGIKVEFANKQKLLASVYCRAYFAPIQEEGGIKKPYSGINLAIPAKNIAPKFYRSNALKKEAGNKQIFKARNGRAIYMRLSSKSLHRLYTLTPQARIKARMEFKPIALSVFNKEYFWVFRQQLDYALRTAR